MSTTDTTDDDVWPKPDAPDGWHWGLGARRTNGYDTWLYTDKVLYEDGEFGWEAHAYQDNGKQHHVEFIQYTKLKPNGDKSYSHPKHQRSFDTEEEAIAYLVSTAKELR